MGSIKLAQEVTRPIQTSIPSAFGRVKAKIMFAGRWSTLMIDLACITEKMISVSDWPCQKVFHIIIFYSTLACHRVSYDIYFIYY